MLARKGVRKICVFGILGNEYYGFVSKKPARGGFKGIADFQFPVCDLGLRFFTSLRCVQNDNGILDFICDL